MAVQQQSHPKLEAKVKLEKRFCSGEPGAGDLKFKKEGLVTFPRAMWTSPLELAKSPLACLPLQNIKFTQVTLPPGLVPTKFS